MKKLMVVVVAWLMVVVVVGCSDPMDVRLPIKDGKLDAAADLKDVVQKLSKEDQGMLAAYTIRSAMVAEITNTPMTAVTLGEAIEAQKKFVAEEKVKADKEAEEQAKRAAEEKAARDAYEANQKRIRDIVSGSLLEKTFRPSDYMHGIVQDTLIFSVLFKNKSSKEIVGMKGMLAFNNTLGDSISSIGIVLENSVPAGGEYVWNGGLKYNQFMDDHVSMRNADISKIVSVWQPEMIMFADGTVERLEEQ